MSDIKESQILELFGELQDLRKQASTNNTTRDRLISVFDELINNTEFKGSPIEKFNTLDAGTRNMIYNNQELMQKVLGGMFSMGDSKDLKKEQNIQVNEFLKNLQEDLENSEYNLINHPENDDALTKIIDKFDNINDDLSEENKKLLEAIIRLVKYQNVKRELLKNNSYYKEQQKGKLERKQQTSTLEHFIENAKDKEDIEQADKLIKSAKFENFDDLMNIVDKYVNKIKEITEEDNIQQDELVIDYINNLNEEELKYFINNALVVNNDEKTKERIERNKKNKNYFNDLQTFSDVYSDDILFKKQYNFLKIIISQQDKINEQVEKNIVSYLLTDPKIYNVFKRDEEYTKLDDKKKIDSLIQKYHDAQLIDYDDRTVTEELVLLGEEEYIVKLENKIKNGEELTESMKNMLLLYSDPKIKETKKERKNQLDKLKQEGKEATKTIKNNTKEIESINKNVKTLESNIKKNEELLKKKQNELYTNYDKTKASFFDKRSFEEKREKLRSEISGLQGQIEKQRKEILSYQQNKQKLEIDNKRLQNRTQQIDKHTGKKSNEGLQGLYKLNKKIDDFKKTIKEKSFSEVIEILEIMRDNDINTAILNSYCKNTDKLNDKDFKELLDYCIKNNDSLVVDDNVKKPLNVLLEKDSLKNFSNDRVYSLLHNEKLKNKTQDILNNLSDNKLSATINTMIQKINDTSKIEDEKKQAVVDENLINLEIIKSFNSKDNITKLQKDGKFESLNTLINYAKDYFSNKDQTENELLNNITDVLEIQKIPDEISNEEINKHKQINKQTINTLKNLYEIYGDNEQQEKQNQIINKFVDGIDNLIDSPEAIYDLIDFADSFYDEKEGQTEEEKKEVELSEDKEFEEKIFEILDLKIKALDIDNKTNSEELKEVDIENIDKQIKELENSNNDIGNHNKEINEHNKKIDENIAKIKNQITTINEIIKLKKELEAIKNDGSEGERTKNLKIQQKQRQIDEKYKTIEGIGNDSSIDDLTKQIETLNSGIEQEEKNKRNDYQNTKSNQSKIEKLTKIKNAIDKGDINELKSLQMKQAQLLDNIDKQIKENEKNLNNKAKINKEKEVRQAKKDGIKDKMLEKLMNIPQITNNPTEKNLLVIESKLKGLCKATANNNQKTTANIKNKITGTLNELINKNQVDSVLNVVGAFTNTLQSLNDDELSNKIYDIVKDKKFISGPNTKNTQLAKTLIQLYSIYDKKEDKTKEKENILNRILSLSNTSIIMCMQNGMCDNLLLKIAEKKPEILDEIRANKQNEKIINQVNRILTNKNSQVKTETKEALQNFSNNYNQESKQQNNQQTQQQSSQQSNQQSSQQNNQQSSQQNNQQQNNQQAQQQNNQQKSNKQQNSKQGNAFVDFFNNPKEFINECSKDPIKMMELMMIINTVAGKGAYPFYQQGKMSDKQYNKYLENPNDFMDKFIQNPMKFVGMIGSSSDKLQACLQAYLDANNGEYPDEFEMALFKVTSYLNNGQQIVTYNNGFAIPNQAMMYQGGNTVLPSNFYAIAVNQMKYEQDCLHAINKQNKIAKKKLKLKEQEIAEMKRANDIKEQEIIMKNVFSGIKSEDLNENNKITVTYSGPSGKKEHTITIEK